MASINLLIQSKKNPAIIYIRLRDGRKIDIKAKTNFAIDPLNWDSEEQRPYKKLLKDIDFANLDTDLGALKTDVLKNYYKNLLIRTSVLFLLSLLCFLLPNSVLINHYYSNEPELKELYLKEQENPEDENIQREIQAYKAKQFEQENGRQRK